MNADDLAKLLDELGKRLGPTGQHVFELAVRQAFIGGVTNLAGAIGCAVAIVLMLRWINRYADADREMEESKPYYTSSREIAYMLGGVGFLVLAGAGTLMGAEAIGNLLNPEYAAIRDLLGAIR